MILVSFRSYAGHMPYAEITHPHVDMLLSAVLDPNQLAWFAQLERLDAVPHGRGMTLIGWQGMDSGMFLQAMARVVTAAVGGDVPVGLVDANAGEQLNYTGHVTAALQLRLTYLADPLHEWVIDVVGWSGESIDSVLRREETELALLEKGYRLTSRPSGLGSYASITVECMGLTHEQLRAEGDLLGQLLLPFVRADQSTYVVYAPDLVYFYAAGWVLS